MIDASAAAVAGDVESLACLLRGRRAVVLAGAGCSTESGIPDYRSPGRVIRRPPVQYQEFVRSRAARVRYWSRSAIGWPRMASARPNAAHVALAELEHAGIVSGVITQNVDGLHHAAGSSRVIELHGALADVRCLECSTLETRASYQARLLGANPSWLDTADANRAEAAPDGDMEIPEPAVESFVIPECTTCGGVMKPDVVFFGENVPRTRVDDAWHLFDEGDILLVAGSSLTVYSGRRFIHRAAECGRPVAIVNIGPTRGDDVACVKVQRRVGDVLPELAALLR